MVNAKLNAPISRRGYRRNLSLPIIICFASLAVLLTALSYHDLKSFRLPNILTAALIITGLGQAYWLNLPIKDHLIGAIIGYSAFILIETLFLKLRGYPGLGRGDAKLLAGGGAWTGWFGLPYIVLLASLAGLSVLFAGLLTGRLKRENINKLALPFGPFLSLAIAFTWSALIMMPWLGS